MPSFTDAPSYYRILDDEDRETPEARRTREIAESLQRMRAGNFPDRALDRCGVDDPGQTPALEHARAYVAQRERTVLVLLGGTGCGKTTAATWATREVGGHRPGFIRAETLERRGRYDHECADWVERRSMLVVDDLGVEYLDGKGAFLSLLDGLVDDFYSNRRRLVITSNLSPSGLRERLTDRVWSRICEAATVAQCGAVDLRRAP